MKPTRSLKIFKLLLTKSQLPYEMTYIMGKSLQMATKELAEYYGKETREIDADSLMPYLLYITILAVSQVNEDKDVEEQSQLYSIEHLMNTSIKVRLMMVEFFTI